MFSFLDSKERQAKRYSAFYDPPNHGCEGAPESRDPVVGDERDEEGPGNSVLPRSAHGTPGLLESQLSPQKRHAAVLPSSSPHNGTSYGQDWCRSHPSVQMESYRSRGGWSSQIKTQKEGGRVKTWRHGRMPPAGKSKAWSAAATSQGPRTATITRTNTEATLLTP